MKEYNLRIIKAYSYLIDTDIPDIPYKILAVCYKKESQSGAVMLNESKTNHHIIYR